MSSSNNPQLILDLDNTLRDVLNQPTTDNIHRCFSLIKQCYYRRLEEEKIIKDDSLYIPTILLLRQFQRFQNPTIFDQLLQEFILLFPLIPICSKKILDDLLCMTSIILTKRIMMTNDEVQQDLYLRFFRSLCLSIKTNREFFYREFLGNFNQNLPMIGHYLSCFLQLYEKIQTLDYRLNILETIWILFSLDCHENDYQEILGQILACFLPGILKTLVQDISTVHQRLIQSTLILLSYLVRCTLHPSTKEMVDQNSIKIELRQMIVERNDQWLMIVDGHLAPLLQRLTKDYLNHESVSVRRVLGIFMLSILAYSSNWLKISRNIAMKTMLALLSTNDLIILKILLGKLFKCKTSFIQFSFELSFLFSTDGIYAECVILTSV